MAEQHGHVKVSNRWFETRLPKIIDAILTSKAEVPEDLVELDIIGPRHTAWGPFTRHSKGRTVRLQRGECLLSYGLLETMYGWGYERARSYIKRKVEDGFLRVIRREGKAGTVYQVRRYDEIQGSNSAFFGPSKNRVENRVPNRVRTESNGSTTRNSGGQEQGANRVENRVENTTIHTNKQTNNNNYHVPRGGTPGEQGEVLSLPLEDSDGSEKAVREGASQSNRPRSPDSSSLPKPGRGRFDYPAEFETVWAACWSRDGGNAKKAAYKAYRATRLEGEATAAELLKAVKEKRAELRHAGKEGTGYAPMLASFFGPAEPWREYAERQGSVADSGVSRMLAAAEQALADGAGTRKRRSA